MGNNREVYRLVIEDVEQRAAVGKRKYGVTLRPHNGRNALLDAYEEALDKVQYLRQLMLEVEDGQCSSPSCEPCTACSIRLIPYGDKEQSDERA
jgi:hypothetical protein